MKKFLSLVLALVMTMSLVTISAGATEYKDLTDKDEIQYEEAVAVLNRIGVITGYDDGSFRPETELTRGAAAKIIVSLLIGPEAASNLPNTYAPYPDVPTGHTFAGVISYCKTAGIISGYGDGTFKPANTLTGYAFAKMLLGAVGYDANLERFVDTGWTMNVAAVGQAAGLFDRLQFDGSAAVTREEACQLALNALKATVVQYSQGLNVNVTGENTNVVVSGGQTRSYKTSNQEFAKNIRTRSGVWQNTTGVGGNLVSAVNNDYYTVEFAEEHFVDLRLEHDKWNPTIDEFGRPSSEWSYKKVTIGTYALEADFEYTTQQAHAEIDDASAKVRAMGLRGYELREDGTAKTDPTDTQLYINGVYQGDGALAEVANIADYTDNGTLVQVYVSNNDADFIEYVAVIHTQLMEVKKVGSDYVSLISYDDSKGDAAVQPGHAFNQQPLDKDVKDVKDDNENYAFLSGLKEGDVVAVVPVADDHRGNVDYLVSKAYTPETVTGTLTRSDMYDDEVVELTVGGTSYKAAQWNKDMKDINATIIKVTRNDVKLTLDEYGNAMLIEDAGSTSEYMVIGNYYKSLENGKLVTYVHGWDVGGDEVDLNLGTKGEETYAGTMKPGDLVRYSSNTTDSSAEWILEDNEDNSAYTGTDYRKQAPNIYNVDVFTPDIKTGNDYELRANNNSIRLLQVLNSNGVAFNTTTEKTEHVMFMKDGVKFIYVTFDADGDVDTIEFMKNSQDVSTADLKAIRGKVNASGDADFDKFDNDTETDSTPAPNPDAIGDQITGRVDYREYNGAEAYFDKNGDVKAVVIKTESGNATATNLMYIKRHWNGHTTSDAPSGTTNGTKLYGYEVAMMTADGLKDDYQLWTNRELGLHTFATYAEAEMEGFEPYYTSKAYDQQMKTTSVMHLVLPDDKDDAFGIRGDYTQVLQAKNTIRPIKTLSQGIQNMADNEWDGQEANILTDLYALSSTDDNRTGEGIINLNRAEFVDMTGNKISDYDDLKDYYNVELDVIINDNPYSPTFRVATLVVVTQANPTNNRSTAPYSVDIDVDVDNGEDEITMTATPKRNANGDAYPEGAKLSYSWEEYDPIEDTWNPVKNGTVGDVTYAVSGNKLTVSPVDDATGKTFRCLVTFTDGKLLTSVEAEGIAVLDQADDSVIATTGLKMKLNGKDVSDLNDARTGDAVVFEAEVKDEAGEKIPAKNLIIEWFIDNESAGFGETLTIEDISTLAGKNVSYKVSVAGSDEAAIPSDAQTSTTTVDVPTTVENEQGSRSIDLTVDFGDIESGSEPDVYVRKGSDRVTEFPGTMIVAEGDKLTFSTPAVSGKSIQILADGEVVAEPTSATTTYTVEDWETELAIKYIDTPTPEGQAKLTINLVAASEKVVGTANDVTILVGTKVLTPGTAMVVDKESLLTVKASAKGDVTIGNLAATSGATIDTADGTDGKIIVTGDEAVVTLEVSMKEHTLKVQEALVSDYKVTAATVTRGAGQPTDVKSAAVSATAGSATGATVIQGDVVTLTVTADNAGAVAGRTDTGVVTGATTTPDVSATVTVTTAGADGDQFEQGTKFTDADNYTIPEEGVTFYISTGANEADPQSNDDFETQTVSFAQGEEEALKAAFADGGDLFGKTVWTGVTLSTEDVAEVFTVVFTVGTDDITFTAVAFGD